MNERMSDGTKDAAGLKRLEEELDRRDRMLEAVRFAAQELLNLDDWEKKAQEVLRLLGEAAGVSRVYIFEKHFNDGGDATASLRYEWLSAGMALRRAMSAPPGPVTAQNWLARWIEVLGRGESVCGQVKDLPLTEQRSLFSRGALSVAAAPICDSSGLWGFIGFDECKRERGWSASELSALRAAAGIFGAAVTQWRVAGAGLDAGHGYHAFLENSPLGVFTFDSSGVINGCNRKFLEIIGATKEKLIGFDMLANVKNEAMRAAIEKALHARTGYYEGEYVSVAGGKKTDVRVNLGPVRAPGGAVSGGVGIVEDITEHKKTYEKLLVRERQLTESQRIARICNWEWDAVKDEACWSEELYNLLGIEKKEFESGAYEKFLRYVHPDDRRIFEEQRQMTAAGAGSFSFEHRLVASGGVVITVLTRGEVVFADNGEPVRMSGTVQDITEVKRMANELNKYRSNLEAIFRSVNDAIITVDMDLAVIEVNDAAKTVCGIPREAIGKNISGYLDSCLQGCVEALREAVAKKDRVEVYRRTCRKEKHPHRCVTLTANPLYGGKGGICGAVLVVRDETRLADLESNFTERRRFRSIVGRSRKMTEVFHLIENLADIQSTVIITGESGTGKELAAEALHYGGVRREKPFVKVNCAGLPEQLLESELFGHVKGAFTGAVRDRVGRFQLADGGTIFLDEIGEISHNVQLRLLRVLQCSEFERVGASDTVRVDIRVIAATNKDLREKVRRGEFREDLYYRLKVIELALPPLRDRMEDMPLLLEHLLGKLNKKFSKGITAFGADAQRTLMEYSWPGNIRELEHALEHAFIMCRGTTIELEHLPPSFCNMTAPSRGYYHKSSGTDETAAIRKALEKTAGNKSRAARLLGMNRRTLYRKIEEYGIPVFNGDL